MGLLGSFLEENNDHPKHRIMKYQNWFLSNIQSTDTVVDIGSHTGKMAFMMSNKARKVYGIEFISTRCEEAKKCYDKNNLSFICADATTFDYATIDKISVVTLSNVLEHIENRVDFLIKLKENIIWQPEKEKTFLIRVPMIDREWPVYLKRDYGMEYRLDLTHYTEYTQEEFEKEIAQAGISIRHLHIKFGEIFAFCHA